MFIITKNGRTIDIFNCQCDADFFYKTRHQKHLYKVENTIKEITEDYYYYMLECMPPAYLDGFIFANSEPLDHIYKGGKNIAVYTACFQKGGKYYEFTTTLELIKKLMPFDFQI